MLFIGAKTIKKKKIASIILHPFRCWEYWAEWNWRGLQPGTACYADPIRGRLPHFGHWSSYRIFLQAKHIYSSLMLSNKQDIHMGTCCWNFRQRQGHVGGVTTGTKQELPASSSVTMSWQSVSCSKGRCTAQAWMSKDTHSTARCSHALRLTVTWMSTSLMYNSLPVRITTASVISVGCKFLVYWLSNRAVKKAS